MAKGIKGSSPKDKPIRTSFIISPVVSKKLNWIAFHSDRDKTSIVDEALNDYITRWEKKNGNIPDKS
jgi:predicted transcriptional regulator